MILNYEEILANNLLNNFDSGHFENASYNLRIGKIINSKGIEVSQYNLPPQGMILVVSEEEFSLNNNTIGYTTVKNKLSISGVLAINIGIVDSGFKGPISSVLINFGKHDYLIKTNDTFMRMTFHEFQSPNTNRPLSPFNTFVTANHYSNERKKDALILGDKFLYLDKEISDFKKETIKGVTNYFAKASGLAALIITALSFLFSVISTHNDSDLISKYQTSKTINEKILKQDSTILAYSRQMIKQDSIIKKNTIDLAILKNTLRKARKGRKNIYDAPSQ